MKKYEELYYNLLYITGNIVSFKFNYYRVIWREDVWQQKHKKTFADR
jgi:uncharacterized membrane protein YoaK (UPF0700 family)